MEDAQRPPLLLLLLRNYGLDSFTDVKFGSWWTIVILCFFKRPPCGSFYGSSAGHNGTKTTRQLTFSHGCFLPCFVFLVSLVFSLLFCFLSQPASKRCFTFFRSVSPQVFIVWLRIDGRFQVIYRYALEVGVLNLWRYNSVKFSSRLKEKQYSDGMHLKTDEAAVVRFFQKEVKGRSIK